MENTMSIEIDPACRHFSLKTEYTVFVAKRKTREKKRDKKKHL